MKTMFRRMLAALGLPLAFGAVPAEAKAPIARPALWSVSDADTTVYLFGTIHLLPEKYEWRSAKFDAALSNAQELVVETIVDDKNPTALMAALASMAFSPNLPPLSQRVPPAKRATLAAAVKQSGIPPAAFPGDLLPTRPVQRRNRIRDHRSASPFGRFEFHRLRRC